MPLTRIDPADFVFNNDDLSVSCWRDENGNPVGDTENTPSFSQQIFFKTGWGSSITNFYIGNQDQGNLQYSRVGVSKFSDEQFLARKTYGALRNIVYGDKNAIFEWGGAERTVFNAFFISKNINLPLLPGSLRLGNLTDDSKINPPIILNCGRAYNLVTGTTLPGGGFSFGSGTGTSGLFLPDIGIILSNTTPTSPFALRTLNPTPTNHVFIRARNTQYNYSMNPSFISGSSGKIIYQDWYDNPQTYITTVGLYNDNNELMATAKLPRPYNKNFHNELLIQVGLNF